MTRRKTFSKDIGPSGFPRKSSNKSIGPLAVEPRLLNYEPEPNSGCWIWLGHQSPSGYGMLSVNGRPQYVHRLIYERQYGPIPNGLELDHRCRMRCCVNPNHLEAVTHRINMGRGSKACQTHCIHGHAFTPENTFRNKNGTRACRSCKRIAVQRWYKKKIHAG